MIALLAILEPPASAGWLYRYLAEYEAMNVRRALTQFDGEFLPQDRIAEKDRYFLGLRHNHVLWGGWHAAVNAQTAPLLDPPMQRSLPFLLSTIARPSEVFCFSTKGKSSSRTKRA